MGHKNLAKSLCLSLLLSYNQELELKYNSAMKRLRPSSDQLIEIQLGNHIDQIH